MRDLGDGGGVRGEDSRGSGGGIDGYRETLGYVKQRFLAKFTDDKYLVTDGPTDRRILFSKDAWTHKKQQCYLLKNSQHGHRIHGGYDTPKEQTLKQRQLYRFSIIF